MIKRTYFMSVLNKNDKGDLNINTGTMSHVSFFAKTSNVYVRLQEKMKKENGSLDDGCVLAFNRVD